MILEDTDIRIRAVEPDDAYAIWDAESDSSQWIQNSMMAPISRQMLLDYALGYDADPFRAGQIRMIAERKSDSAIVGIVDLYNISAMHRNAFIAVYILPEFRRRNYAGKAIALLEEYAFKLLNIRHICAKIMENNKPSIFLFRKCGYTLRGEIPDWYLCGNRPSTLLLFSKILLS